MHWCPAVREGYTPLRAPDESSPGRPSLAQAKTPLLKTALPKTAPVRAARLKSAPRKTAPAKTTPLKTAPLKIAPLTIPDDPRPLDRSRLQRAAGDTPGRPPSWGILLPCCPLPQRGGRLTGDFGVHSPVLRWQVGVIPGPLSRIQVRVSNNQWEVLDDQYFSRFGTWPSGQRDRPEVRGDWRTRVQARGIAAFSAQMV